LRRFRARPARGGSGFRLAVTLPAAVACSAGDGTAPFGGSLLVRYDAADGLHKAFAASDAAFAFALSDFTTATVGSVVGRYAAHNGHATAPAWVLIVSDGFASEAAYSASGAAWTASTLPAFPEVLGLAWTGTAFVAIGSAFDEVATSPDGAVFTAQAGVAIDGLPERVAGAGAVVVVIGYDDSGAVIVPAGIRSDDGGATWEAITFPALATEYLAAIALEHDARSGEWRLYANDDSEVGVLVLASADGGVTWVDRSAEWVFEEGFFPFHLRRSRTGAWHAIATDGATAVAVMTSRDGLSFGQAFTLPAADPSGPFASFDTNHAGHWALSHKLAGEAHCALAYWTDEATSAGQLEARLDEIPNAAAGDDDAVVVFLAPVDPTVNACASAGSFRVRLE
jgi:hypothetical protein